jgi:hypothetical protein
LNAADCTLAPGGKAIAEDFGNSYPIRTTIGGPCFSVLQSIRSCGVEKLFIPKVLRRGLISRRLRVQRLSPIG